MAGHRLIDLTGQRFGRLAVLSRAGDRFTPAGCRMPYWNVLCDCGRQVEAAGVRLRNGQCRSCGCLAKDSLRWRAKAVVSYRAAHMRIADARGEARNHPCVRCDGPAAQWAYMHTDPGELIDARLGLTYSLHPTHYSAMCPPCHGRFDKESRAAS